MQKNNKNKKFIQDFWDILQQLIISSKCCRTGHTVLQRVEQRYFNESIIIIIIICSTVKKKISVIGKSIIPFPKKVSQNCSVKSIIRNLNFRVYIHQSQFLYRLQFRKKKLLFFNFRNCFSKINSQKLFYFLSKIWLVFSTIEKILKNIHRLNTITFYYEVR